VVLVIVVLIQRRPRVQDQAIGVHLAQRAEDALARLHLALGRREVVLAPRLAADDLGRSIELRVRDALALVLGTVGQPATAAVGDARDHAAVVVIDQPHERAGDVQLVVPMRHERQIGRHRPSSPPRT